MTGNCYIARRTSDASKTNNTTLGDDTELVVALAANTHYTFFAPLLITGNSSADFKCALTVPSGTTGYYGPVGNYDNGSYSGWHSNSVGNYPSATLSESSTIVQQILGTGNPTGLMLAGQLLTSSTADDLAIQWAQNSTNGTATTVKQGSRLVVLDQGGSSGETIEHYVKASDTSRSSTTTIADDPDLQFSIGANEAVLVIANLMVDSSSQTPDFKFAWAGPTGTTGYHGIIDTFTSGIGSFALAESSALTTLYSHSTTISTGVQSLSARQGLSVVSVIESSSTTGTVRLQWAQNTSNGTATVLKSYTSMTVYRG